ncbi:prestin-like isoform X3 [Ornithodoros turicata]|uniref:prestin-like isoform X3 n=1 Tax=Ornithodoros turicata TaxID=34597 RepID=UPI0031389C0D
MKDSFKYSRGRLINAKTDSNREGTGGGDGGGGENSGGGTSPSDRCLSRRGHINRSFSMAEEGYGAIERSSEGIHEPTLSGSTVVLPWWIMNDAKDLSSTNNNVDTTRPRIRIHRQAMNQEDIVKQFGDDFPDSTVVQKVKRKVLSCCMCTPVSILYSIFPVLQWLPCYSFSQYFVKDIMAGITVSIMHIPQGLAYGVLAGAGAINGLYVSAFPGLVYFLMGTSRHVSVGTFAVISLLSASAVSEMGAITPEDYQQLGLNGSDLTLGDSTSDPIPLQSMEVLTALAFIVGIIQILMGMLHLGILSIFMSEPMVSGFTTGAAVQVILSQLKGLFGINVRQYSGLFKCIYTFADVIKLLPTTNLVTLAISIAAMAACIVVHECINAKYRAKLKMPVPIDLIVIIISTAVSYFGDFSNMYGVRVMGFVPTGFPTPEIPRLDLIPKLILNAFVVAIVSFTIALSMAKLFGKKHKYQIDPNQELKAIGAANFVTSFLACYPCAVSLSRSSVQDKAGAQTQVSSVISSIVVIVIMLVAGPLFETLPKCILSAVIIVALKGMIFQVRDCYHTWQVSRLDALTWIITFLSVVLLDIDVGIAAGIGFSVVTVILRTLVPYVAFLGQVPNTDIYLDVKRYKKAQEIPRVKIFHFSSAFYFANRDVFKNSLMEVIIGNHDETSSLLKPQEKYDSVDDESVLAVIFDCSACVYIDSSGIETLREILMELRDSNITVYFACCTVPMYKVLLRSKLLELFSKPIVFPTIHDAVLHLPAQVPVPPL